MSDKMREEFEKWALSNEGPSVSVMRNEAGRYEDEELNMAWLGWQAARTVPEGFVMVPVKPTQKMMGFGAARHGSRLNLCMNDAAMIYEAMLSAAQEPKK